MQLLTRILKVWRKCSYPTQMAASTFMSTLQGIVFDMDGTLTVPCLDFKKLRKLLNIDDKVDILGHVETLSKDDKVKSMKIIEDFEDKGRRNLQLQPAIDELFNFLVNDTNLKLALLTRNDSKAVIHFLGKCSENNVFPSNNVPFSIILTREFQPVKPHPAAILHIASKWNMKPQNMIMIGDDKHDILCGSSAGSKTILINNNKNEDTKSLADNNIDTLSQMIPVVQNFITNGMA